MHDYYSCTCPDCGGHVDPIVLSATEESKLQSAFNKVVRWAYKEKKTEITPDDLDNRNVQGLTNEINNVLQDALRKGIVYEIPDAMMQHFSNNVYVFSGCKTFDELRALSDLLKDDKGEIKPFSKFFKDVRQVHDKYNKNYLESEYLFATQSAQMASKWADFEKDGDRYNLQYRTANDSRVRYEHAVLHDITLPPSDPFWAKYFPPNGWRCRCNAVQVRVNRYPVSDSTTANDLGEKATYTVGKGGVNTSAMFRFNPGKQKIIFPETHPYFRNRNVVKHVKETNKTPAYISEYEKKFDLKIDEDIFTHLEKGVPINISDKNPTSYSRISKKVYINKNELRGERERRKTNIIYHEFGHAIDDQLSIYNSDEIKSLMNKYRESFGADRNRKYKQFHSSIRNTKSKYETLLKKARKNNETEKIELAKNRIDEITDIADIIMSLNSSFGFGHTKEYYAVDMKSEREFVAHMFSIKYNGNEVLKQWHPELHNDMNNTLSNILKQKRK